MRGRIGNMKGKRLKWNGGRVKERVREGKKEQSVGERG